MNEARMAKMADRVAADAEDTPRAMFDQALDTMLAAALIIDKNLPLIKPENVPQQAALDNIRETMDEGVMPYLEQVARDAAILGD